MKTPTSLYSRLALATSVTLVVGYFVVYAVYENISAPEIAPSATITSTLMTKIKNSLDDLDARVTSMSSTSVPVGAILMFNTSCPATGWTRVTALDNKFPMGSTTYGTTGGADVHIHTAGTLLGPSHNHMWYNFVANNIYDQVYNSAGSASNLAGIVRTAGYGLSLTSVNVGINADAYTNNDGNGVVTGNTASTSNVPSYVTVVYCLKN